MIVWFDTAKMFVGVNSSDTIMLAWFQSKNKFLKIKAEKLKFLIQLTYN